MRRRHQTKHWCVCGRLRKSTHPVCGHCRKMGMTDAARAKLLSELVKQQRKDQRLNPSVKVVRPVVARNLSRSIQESKVYDPKQ